MVLLTWINLLPNITGVLSVNGNIRDISGFTTTDDSALSGERNGSGHNATLSGKGLTITFNASRSSSVYGRATEARVKNVNCLPILKY